MIVNKNNSTSFGSINKVFEITGSNENLINLQFIKLAQDYGCKNRPLINANSLKTLYKSKPTNGKQHNLNEKVNFWHKNVKQSPVNKPEANTQNEYFFIKSFWNESKTRLGVIFADKEEDMNNINFKAGFDSIIGSLNEALSKNNGNDPSMKEVRKIDLIT